MHSITAINLPDSCKHSWRVIENLGASTALGFETCTLYYKLGSIVTKINYQNNCGTIMVCFLGKNKMVVCTVSVDIFNKTNQ
jgi:hypothetical protein